MKVVLFCGGLGMRMRADNQSLPKPMMPIGSRPVLWHVMRYYAHFGHNEFILCLGYGAEAVKDYFLDYRETASNDFVLTKGGEHVEMLEHRHQRLDHHLRRHRAWTPRSASGCAGCGPISRTTRSSWPTTATC